MVDRRTFLISLGTVAVSTAAAGCGGEGPAVTETASPTGDEATPTSTPTPTQTAEPTATGSPATSTETATGTAAPSPPGRVEVASGPEGRLRFVPADIEISVGTTVVWTAESAGHNVTSKPGASEKCRNPPGAEPFASYEGDQHFAIMDVGETYEHPFEVAGEYVYVCAPHEDQGMIGTITVTE